MTDQEFIKAFESCQISKEAWKHKDHIRMAWFYLRTQPTYESALVRIREGIQKLNFSHGSKTGYHETVTQIFAVYIHNTIRNSSPTQTFENFYASNPWLYDGNNPFRKRHYSDELWKSERARAEFVEPDLNLLPELKR